ncbi:MAG: MarR family transcriptional regulator [Gluconacetobacter diazotrophicus]|nr:MarR family transcriptional regulator [Gluconacetobacter diazotrophicus]
MIDESDDPLQIDRMVCFQIYAASNMLTRLYRPILSALGLTYPQYLVMLVLWESHPDYRPRSVGELGTRLHLDSGTLTPLLKRMEQSGLIARTRDREDERRVLASLTEKGRALRQQALPVPDTLTKKLGLSPHDLVGLRDTITRMVETMAVSPRLD